MYDRWLQLLIEAREDEGINILITTGEGKMFSAGQEIVLPDQRLPLLEVRKYYT